MNRMYTWGSVISTVLVVLVFLFANPARADLTYPVNLTSADGMGTAVGTVSMTNSEYGLLIKPDLTGLPAGIHGFHIHTNPDCGPAEKDGSTVPGLAAGGHFDPTNAGEHAGPYGDGHLGDLPPLYVAADGTATTPVLAPRVSVSDVLSHSLMVHAGGDNFSDEPAPLGGGGARLACGVIGFR
ncbi:MAG: superoxide dismutase [Cu-Zn] SodC [Cyanobacteria bacterium J06648_16]